MTHIAVMALGSLGDINPFLGIGRELVRRGHRVTFFTNPYYEAWVEAAGLPFRPLGTRESFLEIVENPDLWDPNRAMEMIFREAAGLSRETYEQLAALRSEGLGLCVAPFQCFGARIAQEKLGIPLVTVMTNPILVESIYDPVRYPVLQWLARSGPTGARIMYAVVSFVFEQTIRQPVARCRAALGLPPKWWLGTWVWSPERIIGLWPAWLRGPQKDWLPQLKLTGFISYEAPREPTRESAAPDAGFLERRPILFTAGTAMTQGQSFFAAALEAQRRLNRPALFVTKYPEQLPRDLPADVRVLTYAPFGALLPHCAAIVHHGGIGTAARALEAGVPQLVVPAAHDQFDNGHLLRRAGVGDMLEGALSGAKIARQLSALLDSPDVRLTCEARAGDIAAHDALAETATMIEAVDGAR